MTTTDTSSIDPASIDPLDVLIHLDPAALADHPANLRKATGDLAGLISSVKAVGVLEPVLVQRLDDGYRIVAGHRRVAAARAAGSATVPCRIVSYGDGDGDTLVMLVENVQRADLNVAEEAAGYLQLQAAGLSVPTIAEWVGVDPERVTRTAAVGESAVAAAVVQEHNLTLDQAAVIVEFEGDREAVKELTVLAVKQPGQFDHRVSRLRHDREQDAAYAAERARLEAVGVQVLDELPKDPWSKWLSEWADAKGKPLTEDTHRDCPGHRAIFQGFNHRSGLVTTRYLCLDPKKHAHQARAGGGRTPAAPKAEKSDAEREKAAKERREVIEGNRDWHAAVPVRLEFLKGLLASKSTSAPKHLLQWAVLEVVGRPDSVHHATDKLLAEILPPLPKRTKKVFFTYAGVSELPTRVTAATTPAQLTRLLAAQVAASIEATAGPHSWRRSNPPFARYLRALQSAGYTLAPIEQKVLDVTKGDR